MVEKVLSVTIFPVFGARGVLKRDPRLQMLGPPPGRRPLTELADFRESGKVATDTTFMPLSKIQKVLHLIEKSGLGLEVGASYRPMAAKRDGWNVEIADHACAEELREKYAAWGVDGSLIEEVDHLVDDRGLFAAINDEGRYDFIIASHVIEHVPNPVQFLIDCQRLLKEGGILSLVVPDKRFCFDTLKPISTTGDFLQAYLEGRTKHTPGTIFDAYALHVKKGSLLVWPGDSSGSKLSFGHTVREAKALVDEYVQTGRFVDVHAWQFVPESFKMILSDLVELELLTFESAAFFDTVDHQFYISLRKSKDAKGSWREPRLKLAKRAMANPRGSYASRLRGLITRIRGR